MKKLFIKSVRVFTVVVFAATIALTQKASPSSSPVDPGRTTQQTVAPPTATSAPSKTNLPGNQGPAQPAYLTPISGVQGVLAETLDGGMVAAQSIDDKFNPASSIKLATALVALQTLGPDHRFLTSAWSAGTIDKTNATLTGDLILTGRDPSFHYEQAVMMAQELNQLGIRTVKGNLIVAPGFTMNFDGSVEHSGAEIRETFDAARRSASATREWIDDRVDSKCLHPHTG